MMSMAGDAVLLSSPTPRSSLRRSFLSQFLDDTRGAVLENPSSFDLLVHDSPSTITMERSPGKHVSFAETSTKPTSEPFKEVTQNHYTTTTTTTSNSVTNITSKKIDNMTSREKRKRRNSSKKGKDKSEEDQDNGLEGFAFAEMAEAQAQLHHFEAAFELWEKALKVQRKSLGDRHVVVGHTLSRRGVAYAKIGLLYESILDLEKAYYIQQESHQAATHNNNNNSDSEALLTMTDTLLDLAKVQQMHGSYVEAMQSLQQCLSLTKQVYGESHEKVARIVCIIGNFYHQRRHYDQALESYRKGLALYEKAGIPKKNPHVVWVTKCLLDRNMVADGFWTRARRTGSSSR